MLAQFRATSPRPDRRSPAELFFGRPARLNFEIVRPAQQEGGGEESAVHQQSTDDQQSSFKDDHRVQVSKQNRGPFQQGDKVRVRLPHVLKGSSPYSKPMRVVQTLGNWTYKLSDGQVWNARRLRKVYDDPVQVLQMYDEELPRQRSPVLPRRSARPNKGVPPPRYSPSPPGRNRRH